MGRLCSLAVSFRDEWHKIRIEYRKGIGVLLDSTDLIRTVGYLILDSQFFGNQARCHEKYPPNRCI